MCGIVGAIAGHDVVDFLLKGMQRMEYRGYDSAGLAVIDKQGEIKRIRRAGKVKELVQAVNELGGAVSGSVGIAHTRWATHGTPSEQNAHPQMAGGRVLVVHNGIIENFAEFKLHLEQIGEQFESDTDTEVIAKLIYHQLLGGQDLLHAVWQITKQLTGSYAIAVIDACAPDQIVAAKWGAPVIVGVGENGNYLASDPLALLGTTCELVYMQNYELARLSRKKVEFFDRKLQPVEHATDHSQLTVEQFSRGDYPHYMLKEIMEEPLVAAKIANFALEGKQIDFSLFGEGAEQVLSKVRRIHLVACGSSYYAALLGRYWLESWAHIPCQVELASEFRYHPQNIEENSLLVVISQSGETADTLAALRAAKDMGFLSTMAVCNVAHSSIMREADLHWLTMAGVEIGVASTKAFMAQLISLALLTLSFQRLPAEHSRKIIGEIQNLPTLLQKVLELDELCRELAEQLTHEEHIFYLGRTNCYPIALEGALKLKELSYIHGEGLPAGELKHGVLALIEQGTVVIVLVAHNEVEGKIMDNLHEVEARGGKIIVIADRKVAINQPSWQVIYLPELEELTPILMLIPMQLLAYYVACLKGCDVDQPRNLAKSVTVE